MLEMILKRFEQPDGVRTFEKGKLEVVRLGGVTIGRTTYEPLWKWSMHVGRATGVCRDKPAYWWVQRRLAYSLGDSPTRVRIRNPVAWIVRRKETESRGAAAGKGSGDARSFRNAARAVKGDGSVTFIPCPSHREVYPTSFGGDKSPKCLLT